MFEIDIVTGSDNGQGYFRWVGKFILRDKEGYNKDSCVIKKGHIDWTKDAYEIFQRTIANPINNRLKYLMHDNYCLYFKWEENGILEMSYKEKNNDSLSHYISFKSFPTKLLVSGYLAFFTTIVGENDMSEHWYH